MMRRLLSGVGANGYAQLVTAGIQLLSLPVFLGRWDLATYGAWLVISAVPSYLSLADVGMVTAAGNRMTMLHETDRAGAGRAFQSALAFLLAATALAGTAMLAALALMPARLLPSEDARWALAALGGSVLVGLLGGLPEAVYKATHRYALGISLSTSTRLLEWAGGIAGLWWHGSFAAVALGGLLPRVLCTLAMMVHAARTTPEFRWGFDEASRDEVRRTMGPAVSFMAFPLAHALGLQGMTLVVAATLGPAAAAVFNAYRTLARVTVQATAMFGNALWPEFSRLFGRQDRERLARLFRRGWRIGLALSAAAGAAVYALGPLLLSAWGQGKIAFDASLMLWSMACAAAAGAWHVPRVLLMSTNEHGRLAAQFLAVSALGLPLAWAGTRAAGLDGAAIAMLAAEAVMLCACLASTRRLLGPRPAARPAAAARAPRGTPT